ncbi:hypothetical protein PNOK_0970700 [Pyrrhoderma noxium]|uniref:Uncharacterized protein n=1 Tax=Pyrrhoderma noxium TaxID=2282107 RepID=A0A286U542_9AGAM|nr:hypothetical protein PNOK_0970700 [Pyrrhoderma noxium]
MILPPLCDCSHRRYPLPTTCFDKSQTHSKKGRSTFQAFTSTASGAPKILSSLLRDIIFSNYANKRLHLR